MVRIAVAVALLGALAAGGAPATADEPVEGFYVRPSLQITPELPDVRPGIPVELTARLSHPVLEDTPVHFRLSRITERSQMGRRRAPLPPTPECTVPANQMTCVVSLVSHTGNALVVRAWLGGEGALPPDMKEGRLSSLNLFFHPGADCRIEDGEPLDDQCRGGLNSHVQPGRAEPDATDVVLVGWSGTAAAFVDCDDPGADGDTEIETLPANDRTLVYTCVLRNRATGDPVVGAHLAGELMGGPFDDDPNGEFRSDYGAYPYHGEDRRLCTTTAPAGHCEFELTVPGSGPGEALLCFWSDGDNDGQFGQHDDDGGACAQEPVPEVEGNDGADSTVIRFGS